MLSPKIIIAIIAIIVAIWRKNPNWLLLLLLALIF